MSLLCDFFLMWFTLMGIQSMFCVLQAVYYCGSKKVGYAECDELCSMQAAVSCKWMQWLCIRLKEHCACNVHV